MKRSHGRAAVFSSRLKSRAEDFARELVRQGFIYQKIFQPYSAVPPNHFRTSHRPARKNRPADYQVRYQDMRNDGRPPVVRQREAPRPVVVCANSAVGCPRPRAYADGLCKRCHDRREYRTNRELRARKIEQSRQNWRERGEERRKAYNMKRQQKRAEAREERGAA